MTVKSSFWRGKPLITAAYSLIPLSIAIPATWAQTPSTAPPKDTAQKGPEFPKNEQKEPETDQSGSATDTG